MTVRRILVPIDFSPESLAAVNVALARALPLGSTTEYVIRNGGVPVLVVTT